MRICFEVVCLGVLLRCTVDVLFDCAMSAHRLSWESLDLFVLPKNFSYEDNYHRKFYYPKLVYERIRQRHTVKPSNGSAGSLSGISSSSSVPDLLEAFQAESGDVGLSDFTEFDDRTEAASLLSQRDRHKRRVPFSLGGSVDEEDGSAAGQKIEQDDNSSTSTDSVVTTSLASVSYGFSVYFYMEKNVSR